MSGKMGFACKVAIAILRTTILPTLILVVFSTDVVSGYRIPTCLWFSARNSG